MKGKRKKKLIEKVKLPTRMSDTQNVKLFQVENSCRDDSKNYNSNSKLIGHEM